MDPVVADEEIDERALAAADVPGNRDVGELRHRSTEVMARLLWQCKPAESVVN